MNKPQAEGKRKKEKGKVKRARLLIFAFCLLPFALIGCRYDMQDTPRYEVYEKSDFFADNRASRDLPEGTVPRGFLRDNKAFYTGKRENAGGATTSAPVQTTTDAAGNTLVTSFPDAIDEFPVPVTEELINRGQERYNIYCSVCHGPTGRGDGMVVRRGYYQPPTYHDDRLRNAPVGHFFDVITNGWGRMNSYAGQVPVADRWAIVAYIRALQISQNPNGNLTMTPGANTTNANVANANTTQAPQVSPNANTNTNTQGGTR
ncbi:MAG TPA: cytochrome c [Pyrinomonadaceae bacterium]|nr:cytochrome c [Pyrinomonadaceae bacterium]